MKSFMYATAAILAAVVSAEPIPKDWPSTATPSATSRADSSDSVAPPAPTTTVVVSGGFFPNGTNNLQFNPQFLRCVQKGEPVLFDFRKLNHTLTESTFENPCKRKASAQAGDGYAAAAALIDTDFQNANPTDTPLLKATTVTFDSAAHAPRYFYCRQGNSTPKSHCGAGMVFAVNVDEDRFRAFQARARATLPKPA